jgi:hypothetical protein
MAIFMAGSLRCASSVLDEFAFGQALLLADTTIAHAMLEVK